LLGRPAHGIGVMGQRPKRFCDGAQLVSCLRQWHLPPQLSQVDATAPDRAQDGNVFGCAHHALAKARQILWAIPLGDRLPCSLLVGRTAVEQRIAEGEVGLLRLRRP
jgi:hypothetical protein